jgi:hypothetical protein
VSALDLQKFTKNTAKKEDDMSQIIKIHYTNILAKENRSDIHACHTVLIALVGLFVYRKYL